MGEIFLPAQLPAGVFTARCFSADHYFAGYTCSRSRKVAMECVYMDRIKLLDNWFLFSGDGRLATGCF